MKTFNKLLNIQGGFARSRNSFQTQIPISNWLTTCFIIIYNDHFEKLKTAVLQRNKREQWAKKKKIDQA